MCAAFAFCISTHKFSGFYPSDSLLSLTDERVSVGLVCWLGMNHNNADVSTSQFKASQEAETWFDDSMVLKAAHVPKCHRGESQRISAVGYSNPKSQLVLEI